MIDFGLCMKPYIYLTASAIAISNDVLLEAIKAVSNLGFLFGGIFTFYMILNFFTINRYINLKYKLCKYMNGK